MDKMNNYKYYLEMICLSLNKYINLNTPSLLLCAITGENRCLRLIPYTTDSPVPCGWCKGKTATSRSPEDITALYLIKMNIIKY